MARSEMRRTPHSLARDAHAANTTLLALIRAANGLDNAVYAAAQAHFGRKLAALQRRTEKVL